jgi:phosphate transport system permease protein
LNTHDTKVTTAAARFDRPLLLSARQDMRGYLLGKAGRFFLFALTSMSVLAVLMIFAYIIREALPFFAKHRILEFISSNRWYPQAEKPEFGALSLFAGSLYVTVGSLVFSVPTGLLAAVFLSDMVSLRVRQIVKPIIEILAAIPSVAYGFFAAVVVAPWMQKYLYLDSGANALNAAFILGIMAMPTIISVAEDALSAAGRELREASYALGATRAETIVKVMLPAAHSGIIAAVILGMMRAIGETMVVWMASGNAAQIPTPWWDLSQSVRTMTATIAGDMGETPAGSDHRRALFAVGLALLIFTFLMNLASEHYLRRVSVARMGRAK